MELRFPGSYLTVPNEISNIIFKFLPFETQVKIRKVARSWRNAFTFSLTDQRSAIPLTIKELSFVNRITDVPLKILLKREGFDCPYPPLHLIERALSKGFIIKLPDLGQEPPRFLDDNLGNVCQTAKAVVSQMQFRREISYCGLSEETEKPDLRGLSADLQVFIAQFRQDLSLERHRPEHWKALPDAAYVLAEWKKLKNWESFRQFFIEQSFFFINDSFYQPIHLSIALGCVDLTRQYLEENPDLSQIRLPENAISLLHMAICYDALHHKGAEMVQLLLNHGASVNEGGSENFTPLRLATLFGYNHLVAQLIEKGADVDLANNNGFKPLSIALEQGNSEAIGLLLKARCNIDYYFCHTFYGEITPFLCLAKLEDVRAFELLFEFRGDEMIRLGLQDLDVSDAEEVLLVLIERRRSKQISLIGPIVRAVKHYAAANREYYAEEYDVYAKTPLAHAVLKGYFDEAEALLEVGASIEGCLEEALKAQNVKACRFLIEHGADPTPVYTSENPAIAALYFTQPQG